MNFAKSKKQSIAMFKIYLGLILFWFSGGALLIILGLTPASAIIATLGLLSMGTISAATLSIITALGIIWIAIGIPVALRGIAWIEEGVYELVKFKLGITKIAQDGTNKIPLVGSVVKLSTTKVG
jgi:hypothetical protein